MHVGFLVLFQRVSAIHKLIHHEVRVTGKEMSSISFVYYLTNQSALTDVDGAANLDYVIVDYEFDWDLIFAAENG
jgi:hypothetical protein